MHACIKYTDLKKICRKFLSRILASRNWVTLISYIKPTPPISCLAYMSMSEDDLSLLDLNIPVSNTSIGKCRNREIHLIPFTNKVSLSTFSLNGSELASFAVGAFENLMSISLIRVFRDFTGVQLFEVMIMKIY